MKLITTELDGVWIIEPQVHVDNRGFFMESYNEAFIRGLGIPSTFVQDNHSLSKEAGTIRGLHFQSAPRAQTKLVRAASGAIYDVAVDIRPRSATFGRWVGVILSADNRRQLLIPQGFAHGFCTLAPNTEVLYKVDDYYSREHDGGIAWNDPDLGIPWPFAQPVLSEKDGRHPRLRDWSPKTEENKEADAV